MWRYYYISSSVCIRNISSCVEFFLKLCLIVHFSHHINTIPKRITTDIDDLGYESENR